MAGIAMGRDESETMARMEKVRNIAQRDEALRRIEVNPEGYLNALKKGTPAMIKDLTTVTSDPGKMQEMRNNAKGYIAAAEIEKGRLSVSQTARIKKAAMEPDINVSDYEKKIRQSDGLTVEQKIEAMKLFNQSRQTMAKGGANAYVTTENWILYSDHRERASKGNITEQEIMDNVGPGGYSWTQAERLIRVVNGEDSSAKAFEESAAAKDLKAIIDNELDVKTDVELNRYAVNKYSGILEGAIQDNPDWTKTEKKMEALRIGRQFGQDYDDGTLEASLEAALKRPITGEDLDKIDLSKIRKRRKITKTATNPTTGERIGWNGTKWVKIQ
jgi:hypothetical protein